MAASSCGSSPRPGIEDDFDELDSFDAPEERDYGEKIYRKHNFAFM